MDSVPLATNRCFRTRPRPHGHVTTGRQFQHVPHHHSRRRSPYDLAEMCRRWCGGTEPTACQCFGDAAAIANRWCGRRALFGCRWGDGAAPTTRRSCRDRTPTGRRLNSGGPPIRCRGADLTVWRPCGREGVTVRLHLWCRCETTWDAVPGRSKNARCVSIWALDRLRLSKRAATFP